MQKLRMRKCPGCGSQFRPTTRGQLYCTGRCYHVSRKGVPRGPYKERETRKCKYCGKDFQSGAVGASYQKSYCSVACRQKRQQPTARRLTRTEAAWLAALVDGEGSIINPLRSRGYNSVTLAISNTSIPLLEQALRITGTGRIKHVKRAGERNRDCYQWVCYGDNARSLSRQILPWLIVKRDRALDVL